MILSKPAQIQEIIKCGKDPAYFFNTYCRIQHPQKGLIPFHTFPFQDKCVEDFIKYRFNIILKARQLGLSTLTAAYAVWLSIFYKDQNILIIATKLKVAQNLIRKVKTIIHSLPQWLLLTQIVADNRQEVEFKNGSSIKAIPTSEDAGRSEALSLLIIDEAAFVKNFDEIWTGLYSTLTTGGRAIIMSTPNGVGGKYHDLYSQAEAGLNDFNAIKLLWNVHPEHDQKWFEKEKRNMSERQLSQELECDFLSSGDTYLGQDDLKWIGSLVKAPSMRTGPDNNVWIWKTQLPMHKYILTADVSRGDAQDFSAFEIIDTGENEVVAEYKGKMRPDKFAELLDKFGRQYNTALICPENNNFGYAVCMKLREVNYPRMYYQENKATYLGDYIPPQDLSKAGFNTTGHSRSRILAKLEELIRNKQLLIYSSRFYDELKTFVWQSDKAQAMRGKHDDLVMSMAIGAWLLDASDGYSHNSAAESAAMLSGMGTSKTEFKSPEIQGAKNPFNAFKPIMPNGNESIGMNAKTKRETNFANDFKWLFGK